MRRWLAVAIVAPSLLSAQSTPRRPYDFSALLFGNFQVRTDSAARVGTGGEPMSRFDLGRGYLTFQANAGDRASVRVTTDIFQNSSAGYYGGWALRLKYGILQYRLSDRFAGVEGLVAAARIGMLHTVTIGHVQNFWPRWLGSSALETHGFFASADVGAAAHFAFPGRKGEAYVTVTNGPGYSSGEVDRFKDVAARVSFTPFAGDSGWYRTFAISPWYYLGNTASQFARGGAPQVGTVPEGVQRDRRGIFVGLRERRLTAGAEFSQRIEGIEGGQNTVANPRTVAGRTSNLFSAFGIARPMELMGSARRSPLSLIGRYDRFKLDTGGDPQNEFLILGAIWDLDDRVSLALDHQSMKPTGGSGTLPTRTWFLHWTASF